LKLAPTDPWVQQFLCEHHENRASTLIQAGRHEEAAKAVDGLVKELSAWQEVYHRGAELLLRCAGLAPESGERHRARARELVDIADKVPTRTTVSQDHFAWFLLTSDESLRDPTRALRLAQTVTKTVPERLRAWRTQSLAHYRLGQWGEAERALQPLLVGRSDESVDPATLCLQAMIEWRQGSQAEARRIFNRATTRGAPDKTNDSPFATLLREARLVLK
jgi:predicted Zn-dependent protease